MQRSQVFADRGLQANSRQNDDIEYFSDNHSVATFCGTTGKLRYKFDKRLFDFWECVLEISVWLGFFAASWAISISPGPGAVYAMSCGLNHGLRQGYMGTIGMIFGMMTALGVTAVGLGALLLASAHAFTVLKWAGVAYLIYLGIKQWRAPGVPIVTLNKDSSASADDRASDATTRALIVKGWAVNATNPKGYIFMMAVMPQFLDPSRPLMLQYVVIGATLCLTDAVVMAGYTGFAAKVLSFFKTEAQMKMLNRIFGGLFVAAAGALATFKRGA
jgi:homoserine/homoserine lactone efflux protein